MVYKAALELSRLRVSFPQEVKGYDNKRTTRKRKSTLYFYSDGSHIESRKSRFIAWSPTHDKLAITSKWHNRITINPIFDRCFFEYDDKSGKLVGTKLETSKRWEPRISKTIALDADPRLNVLKRIDNVALWLGIPRPVIRYNGLVNKVHQFAVSCGTPHRDPDLYPTFL